MRKKAQERKKNSSPVSPSSSSLSCVSPSYSEPPPETKVETGGYSAENGENDTVEAIKAYSMDQIWNEIATPDAVSGMSFEECRNEACGISCPPIPSPMWEYCSDSLWKLDDDVDDDFKMFPP